MCRPLSVATLKDHRSPPPRLGGGEQSTISASCFPEGGYGDLGRPELGWRPHAEEDLDRGSAGGSVGRVGVHTVKRIIAEHAGRERVPYLIGAAQEHPHLCLKTSIISMSYVSTQAAVAPILFAHDSIFDSRNQRLRNPISYMFCLHERLSCLHCCCDHDGIPI